MFNRLLFVSFIWCSFSLHAVAEQRTPNKVDKVCPSACDAPSLPALGRAALQDSNGDAYKAVKKLLPAASAGDVNAQISIAFIMQDRLNGHLGGASRYPFSWREMWSWYLLAAQKSGRMLSELAAGYFYGEKGLQKNEKLGDCLATDDGQPASSRISNCFERYSN